MTVHNVQIQLNESEFQSETSHNLKQSSIENFIPLNQRLYDENHAILIPKNHKQVSIDGDVIGLSTIFDEQAASGSFIVPYRSYNEEQLAQIHLDQKTEQISSNINDFAIRIENCLTLRDEYQNISHQRSFENPLNDSSWESYPPPQPKAWHYEDEYGSTEYYYDENAKIHYYGIDHFDLEDYKVNSFDPFVSTLKGVDAQVRLGKLNAFEIIETGNNIKHNDHQKIKKERLPTFNKFFQDLKYVIDTSIDKTGVTLSARRIAYLHAKFDSYLLQNEQREIYLTKLNPHRDFYNVRKVDNNIDVSMAMSKKVLLNFMNIKLKKEPNRIVYKEGEVSLTLKELFEPYLGGNSGDERLNIDDLFEFGLIDRTMTSKLQLDSSTHYEAFIKDDALLKIDRTFLGIDNHIGGEYLSEIIQQVLSDHEKSKYQFAEIGLSFNLSTNFDIQDPQITKWDSLSNWIIDNKLISYNCKWIIRVPRNYSYLRSIGKVSNFQDYLDAIFKELFEISINPAKNIKLHYFLTKVSSFDLLSGAQQNTESIYDIKHLKSPTHWTEKTNPPYCYYLYYLFINISNLNKYRKSRGLCTFSLRPHTASITDKSGGGIITETLAANYLLSKNIIQGERLINYPALQYLYYLKQIGITMSPLCWNKTLQLLNDDGRNVDVNKAASYETSSLIDFFRIGMKVSFSTNKPLFSSLTREPLIEEYSVAASIHKLSSVDLSELCRNSVLISEFNGKLKTHWIGVKYLDTDDSIDHVDSDEFSIQRHNVPNMRLDYRRDTLHMELDFIKTIASNV